MNVTSVGTTPAPVQVAPTVQRAAAADPRTGTGGHETPPGLRQPQRPEPEKVEHPPLKPVTVQEFRVIVGALPASVLVPRESAGTELDVYA